MKSNEKSIENFAYATGVTLPVARKVVTLLEEGVGLFRDDDRRCLDYMVQGVGEAIGNGEQWARDFGATLMRQMIGRCVEQEADPAGAVARKMRVDRMTAEGWIREVTGR